MLGTGVLGAGALGPAVAAIPYVAAFAFVTTGVVLLAVQLVEISAAAASVNIRAKTEIGRFIVSVCLCGLDTIFRIEFIQVRVKCLPIGEYPVGLPLGKYNVPASP